MDAVPWLETLWAAPWAKTTVGLVVMGTLALLVHAVVRRKVEALVEVLVRRTETHRDEVLLKYGVLERLTALLPLLVLQVGLPLVPGLTATVTDTLQRFVVAVMLLVGARAVDALLSAGHHLYRELPTAATRPIRSWVQLARILLFAGTGVLLIAQLSGKSPWVFVSGLGAMMAVILLIFRDTLLSLVASVKLSSNDLLRVGDWLEMPQFSADGDVVDLSLSHVTVQNWDKTISVIPTHKFLDHSFRNWRGMSESGGRRIKRSLLVATDSVRFLTDPEVERLGRMELLSDYVAGKRAELEAEPGDPGGPSDLGGPGEPVGPLPDGIQPFRRRLTNLGTFRAYLVEYLRRHRDIHQDMTLLVRHLEPTAEGVPIEIYAFSNDTAWGRYEAIQADLFDHVLAVAPEFDLRVYQRPAGHDLRALRPESPLPEEALAGAVD